MPEPIKIRRALISVYDKTGIVEFARALHEEFGVEIISTGGTAKALTEAAIPVTLVEDITGFPEMLDGRVKTLHPKIHAAILADRDDAEHMRQLAEQGIKPIDMVVVNLYPFEKTVADPNCKFEDALETIDIGGPCLLRAAAKNHRHVLVLHDPVDLQHVLDWIPDGLSEEGWQFVRRNYARSAFRLAAAYNAAIVGHLSRHPGPEGEPADFHAWLLTEWGRPRYGENPHQSAEVLCPGPPCAPPVPHLLTVDPTTGGASVELSFNNYVDASAALELCAELTRAARVRQMWHRRPAGEESVAPASRRWKPVGQERHTRRNLPHIQNPGRSYFVTFRVRQGQLPPVARDLALSACQFWHGRKMTLHIATVMPDHVHLLLTPYLFESGESVPLAELLHSIKSYTAHRIARKTGFAPPIWLDESWDRIMRHESEFRETWEYIETNPIRAQLGRDYRWVWFSQTEFEEAGYVETGASHRRDAGATGEESTPCLRACCFIKHTNACGVGSADDPVEAYRRAYLGDPNAAMGGILAVNFNVEAAFAEAVMESLQRWGKAAGAGAFFVEVWVAPSFDDEAVEIIRTKKKWGERVRLLAVGDMCIPPDPDERDIKTIAGGVLMQTPDLVGLNEDEWKIATERAPTERELSDLRLAWLIAKHTKSNAISICKDGMLIGNGAGQMSRVMSCRIATWLAKENGHAEKLEGTAAASDAFFPFRDGPDILTDAGVTAIIQPGGSKRDQEVIDACNERGAAMIFTGTRHFRH
jgi:AICAR transformylase/IMP cyclohydrolase PurH/REP element-mobilizing transposase RayT